MREDSNTIHKVHLLQSSKKELENSKIVKYRNYLEIAQKFKALIFSVLLMVNRFCKYVTVSHICARKFKFSQIYLYLLAETATIKRLKTMNFIVIFKRFDVLNTLTGFAQL